MPYSTDAGTNARLDEPEAHVVSRRLRLALRSLLLAALVATILLLLFYRPAAYLAAVPIPFLYGLLVVVNYYERQSRAEILRSQGANEVGPDEVTADVDAVGLATVLGVLALLALGTFIIAAAYYDLAMVGIVAAALFFLAVLIELPYLFLIASEAGREEREKLDRRSGSGRPSQPPG